MIRGTTPTLTFILPMDASLLAEAWITFVQAGDEVFNKTLSDCVQSGSKLLLTLEQEDTLLLNQETNTQIQLRIRTLSGVALASQIISVETERILKEGVI